MRSYVIDASVIVKWVMGDREEPDQEKATRLLTSWAEGKDDLWAPTLWEYEVANFLGREFAPEAKSKMEILRKLGIRGIALTDAMIERCFLWMKTKNVSFYDAAYLAAAHEVGAVLVTADAKFVRKMDSHEPMIRLKDLSI